MGTHCIIAREASDGKIEAIYCHYDGGPRTAIPELRKNYNTHEKLKQLIHNGDIRSIAPGYVEYSGQAMTLLNNSSALLNWARYQGAEYVYLKSKNTWVMAHNIMNPTGDVFFFAMPSTRKITAKNWYMG